MKTKQIILTIALLFSVSLMRAQDKYEYAVIQHNTARELLSISIDGETLLTEKIELKKDEVATNANLFLKKVKEYQDKGWEVLSFNTMSVGAGGNIYYPAYFCYMKKKGSK